jgi:hypothetical protein
MKVCILDAWSSEDAALVNSHWVAERTAAVLRRVFVNAEVTVMSGDTVDRAFAEAQFAENHDGFAYFGHGRENVLYRCTDDSNPDLPREKRLPIPILGIEQIALLGPRWFHAFACLSGNSLCKHAANAGVAAYLGYNVKVNVTWDPSELPEELRQLLQELVTVATTCLASGERSRSTIRRRVKEVSDRLIDWVDRNEEACQPINWIDLTALYMLANQLHEKLELQGVAVVP